MPVSSDMGASSADDDFVAEINVTPFVDVMLVLLVIFMITAPMMTEGLSVALPSVETSETLTTEDDHVILTIRADGALYINECPTDMASLPQDLGITVTSKGKQLFVQADKAVSYGAVLRVMDRVRSSGIRDVNLVTSSSPDDAAQDTAHSPAESSATKGARS